MQWPSTSTQHLWILKHSFCYIKSDVELGAYVGFEGGKSKFAEHPSGVND